MPSASQSQDAALTSIPEAEERQGRFLLKSLASVQAKHFVVALGERVWNTSLGSLTRSVVHRHCLYGTSVPWLHICLKP